MGAQTADLALEILAGKDPNTIAPQLSTAGAYRVDARQLQRWQLSDTNLPAGTVVSFREDTLWDEHRYLLLSVLAALGLQSAIIAYVLIQNRRRRTAEKSLAENEERMAFAAASTNTGLWQFETEDNPIWATKHCRSMFGLAENAPLSLDTLRDSIHPDDRRALVRAIRAAASSGRPTDGEFRVVLPSGETRWIAMKSYPSHRENNGRYYVNGIFSDVTALKRQRARPSCNARKSLASCGNRFSANCPALSLTSSISRSRRSSPTQRPHRTSSAGRTIDLEKIQEIVADIIEEDNRAGEVISRIRKLLRKGESKSEPIDLNQLVESTLHLLRGEYREAKDQHRRSAGREPADDFWRSGTIAASAAQCNHERDGGDEFESAVAAHNKHNDSRQWKASRGRHC